MRHAKRHVCAGCQSQGPGFRRLLPFLLLTFHVSSVETAHAATRWATLMSTGGMMDVTAVERGAGGNYYFAGSSSSTEENPYDGLLGKFDPSGRVLWQRLYGGSDYDYFLSVCPTRDSGVVAAGQTGSWGAGNRDAWLVRLSEGADIVWQYAYGGRENDGANCVVETADGGFIVAGETRSYGAGDYDVWIFKVNSNGKMIWQRTYGGTGQDRYSMLRRTQDGGYLVGALSRSFGAGSDDAWLLKLDASGNIQWQNTYGGSSWDEVWDIRETNGGGYVFAGITDSFGPHRPNQWILKLDASGGILWQKTLDGGKEDRLDAVYATPDGSFIACGDSDRKDSGEWDAHLVKIDSSGKVVWQKTYGRNNRSDGANSLAPTEDGGFVVVGRSGDQDGLMFRIASGGSIDPSCAGFVKTGKAKAGNSTAMVTKTAVKPGTLSSGRKPTKAAAVDFAPTMTTICQSPSGD